MEGGYIHVDTSMLLHKCSQDMSMDPSLGLTMATRMMAMIITTTVTEKILIKINFWRKGMRTCQSIRTGIEMTIFVLKNATPEVGRDLLRQLVTTSATQLA